MNKQPESEKTSQLLRILGIPSEQIKENAMNEWEENAEENGEENGDLPLPPVWDEKRGEYVSETPNQLFARSMADLRRLMAQAEETEAKGGE